MYTHMLVPLDGSKLSEAALTHAVELAIALRAKVSALHVVTDFVGDVPGAVPLLASSAKEAFAQRAIGEAESILSTALRLGRAHDLSIATRYVFAAEPSTAIISEAQRGGCDLIVMASHGRRGLEALLLGSETQKVLTHCQIPVLVVRGGERGTP